MSTLRSTVSGTVIEVLVKVGEKVAVDRDIVLVESMKMEIPVAAEQAGVVREILVAKGDVISEGQALAELGPFQA